MAAGASRDRARWVAGLLRSAAVCLLVLAGRRCSGLPAASPAIQNNVVTSASTIVKHVKDECAVSLRFGARSGGGQRLTVSAPERCHCPELELELLQRRGIPCPPDSRCAWLTTHSASTNTSSAEFLVSVGGQFRPLARCDPPRPGGRRRDVLRLFTGQPFTVPGIDLPSWNASLAADTDGDDLVVRVLGQTDAAGTDAYFPELYVILYRPPQEGELYPRRVGLRRVAFSPAERGARVTFTDVALGSLYGYWVDVRPAGSWVCQGANDGCQRRYATVEELLELSEQARLNPAVES